MILFIISGIVALIAIVIAAFVNLHPVFGGKHTDEDIARFKATGHYEDGKFMNLLPTKIDYSFSNVVGMLKEYAKGNPNKDPKQPIPFQKLAIKALLQSNKNWMVWFGHSTFLMSLDGKIILIDPMLGNTPAPLSWLGPKRYSAELPISIEDIPHIDLMLISHDHYDHLDYGTMLKLKEKCDSYFVSLGVAAHLVKWGVDGDKIKEHQWWAESHYEGLDFAFVPSRHFSGRGLGNNSSTLWGGWILKGDSLNIYFSGDSGYGNHFKVIGEKYGPFDFGMMECGQYNQRWASIHMMPEETAQAAQDAQVKVMMPAHWAGFTLALHDWNEPAKRVLKKAQEINQPITIPQIGEVIWLDGIEQKTAPWWE